MTCATYAKNHGLLDEPGWRRFGKLSKKHKKLLRAVNQSILVRQVRRSTVYKFGYEVPRNHTDALRLDEESGTGKWLEAEGIELAQIDEYDTFQDKGKAQLR